MRRPGSGYALGACVSMLVLLSPTGSWAHQAVTSASPTVSAGDWLGVSGSTGGGLLLSAIVVGIGLGLLRRRGLVAGGLALLLLTLHFEAGLHSTHHLGAPAQAAACGIAVAAAHLTGNPIAIVTVDPDVAPVFGDAFPAPSIEVAPHRPAPHVGRAPPVSAA